MSVEEVAGAVARLGRSALMAETDIRKAYRHVPIHPRDRLLLGMIWHSKVFVNATLPFGLRSAPVIFTAIADAAMWVMQQ